MAIPLSGEAGEGLFQGRQRAEIGSPGGRGHEVHPSLFAYNFEVSSGGISGRAYSLLAKPIVRLQSLALEMGVEPLGCGVGARAQPPL